jgi:hypothetical protein
MSKLVMYGVAAFLLNCFVLTPAHASIIVNINVDNRDMPLGIAPDDYPYGQGLSAWKDLKNNPWVVNQTWLATTPIATSNVAETPGTIAPTRGVSDSITAATAVPDLAYGGDAYAESPYQLAVLLTDFYRLDYDAVAGGFGEGARSVSDNVKPGLYDLVVAAVGRAAAGRLTGNLSDSSYHDFSETFGFTPIDPLPDPMPEPSSIIVLASGLLAIYRKLQK